MNDYSDQYEFREADPSPSDPLERLVEAFIDQSVPLGPDAATQRRMLAAMAVLSEQTPAGATLPGVIEVTRTHQPHMGRPSAMSRNGAAQHVARGNGGAARHWSGIFVRNAVGLAATIALVVGAAMFMTPGRPTPDGDAALAIQDPAIEQAPQIVDATGVTDSRLARELGRLIEVYLRTHGGQTPDQNAINAMLAAVLHDHPDFAKSQSWRLAQQRLTHALEQPEVIGLSVGLLGALPMTSYPRF